MEILLNFAWAMCSVALIACWWRGKKANAIPVHVQLLALGMVVLLLLPVISLSDDLAAMQGAFEADRSVRRILHEDRAAVTAMPAFLAMPQEILSSMAGLVRLLERPRSDSTAICETLLSRPFSSRPPPQA